MLRQDLNSSSTLWRWWRCHRCRRPGARCQKTEEGDQTNGLSPGGRAAAHSLDRRQLLRKSCLGSALNALTLVNDGSVGSRSNVRLTMGTGCALECRLRLFSQDIAAFGVTGGKVERNQTLHLRLPRQRSSLPCRKVILPCSLFRILLKEGAFNEQLVGTRCLIRSILPRTYRTSTI